MTRKYICSDLHISHKNIEKFRPRGFTSEEQHTQIIEELKSLNKRDICYVLGDCVFDEEGLQRLLDVRCRLKLVAGNHCMSLTKTIQYGVFEEVYGLLRHKNYWLTHSPIHHMELRGKLCGHGHLHYHLVVDNDDLPDPNYRTACLEYTNWKPILWDYFTSDEYFEECVKKWKQYKLDGMLVGHNAG